jgi:pimeloyl-ACP methyl ester carboxylesterase
VTGPYYPIIYVRGYAMTQGAVEETVADPYMGFNLGSTKVRQRYPKQIDRHIFESPLVRLMKDEGYVDTFRDGSEIDPATTPPDRAVWIYRYYEPASADLGQGKRSEIEVYAEGLLTFINALEQHYNTPGFRVYLVAHSMGGLICRSFLQRVSKNDRRVDKVFTYATPHGGIDLRILGNVPGIFGFNNSDTFSEGRMREYLGLPKKARVQSLNGCFPEERFFSLVGTNHDDYGMQRFAVGPMSDGLVRISNAYADDTPRAFVHRSHSGHYGIVNSEDGYQNLRRFLFGNVRVDAFLDVEEISLPPAVQAQKDKGKTVNADYHLDVVARVRGGKWDLHRRTHDEGSAVLMDYDKVVRASQPVHLASIFLSNKARVDEQRPSLGFSLDLAVLVPEYKVDGTWFLKNHYDGGYLFRDKVNLEATLTGAAWQLRYGWDSRSPNATQDLAVAENPMPDNWVFLIPVDQSTTPGLKAVLRLETRPWND